MECVRDEGDYVVVDTPVRYKDLGNWGADRSAPFKDLVPAFEALKGT
jgi:hypothetical protein